MPVLPNDIGSTVECAAQHAADAVAVWPILSMSSVHTKKAKELTGIRTKGLAKYGPGLHLQLCCGSPGR